MTADPYFDAETMRSFQLEYTFEPFVDSLEERGAGPRETLELVSYFETVFEDQLITQVETLYSKAYTEANPDGASIYLKDAYIDPLTEEGSLTFTADEEPDPDAFDHVRESLETALDHVLGHWAHSSTVTYGDRLEGFAFRPTYRWEDGTLVFDEDLDADGPVMRWVDERWD